MARVLFEALCDLADARDELLAEDRAERARRARMNHWCTECLGMTGPGSPCYVEPEPAEEVAEEDEEC